MIQWAGWTCATCQAEHEDPVTIKATTCANGHTNYLGPVLQSQHRRAFKTEADRRAAAREDKHVRAVMTDIARAWNKSRAMREAK